MVGTLYHKVCQNENRDVQLCPHAKDSDPEDANQGATLEEFTEFMDKFTEEQAVAAACAPLGTSLRWP